LLVISLETVVKWLDNVDEHNKVAVRFKIVYAFSCSLAEM